MAVLDTQTRQRIWGAVQRWWSDLREPMPFTKAQLQAAVDATDDWIDSNASSYNTALPAAFRNNATAAQKTILFCFVALKRAGQSVPKEN